MKYFNGIGVVGLAGLVMASGPAVSAQTGISASVNSEESNTISIPINFEGVRVEPFLGRFQSNSQFGSIKSDLEVTTFGIGVYKLNRLSDRYTMYVGASLAYGFRESDSTSDQYEETEYSLAPQLGLEWSLSDYVSIDGAIGVRWTDGETELESGEKISFDSLATFSSLGVTFYFP